MDEIRSKPPKNTFERFMHAVFNGLDAPVIWFKETVVAPNQQQYPWYHQEFRRVPGIDQCYTDDSSCYFEANEQFKRDKKVDNEILSILRYRYEDCVLYESPDSNERCKDIWEAYKVAETNWFSKYGDLGYYGNVKDAYMKQKHRMIWERRHGKIGSGRKDKDEEKNVE